MFQIQSKTSRRARGQADLQRHLLRLLAIKKSIRQHEDACAATCKTNQSWLLVCMLTSYKHERHDHEDSLQLEIRQYGLYRLRGCYKSPARAKIGSSRAADYHIIRPSQSPGKQRGRTIYSTMKMTQARPKAMQANMQIRPACTCMCLSRARRTHISRFWHPTASSRHPSHPSHPSNQVTCCVAMMTVTTTTKLEGRATSSTLTR